MSQNRTINPTKTAVFAALTMIFAIIILGSAIYTAIMEPSATLFSKTRRLCDQMVEALLNSDNLVDVTRAGFVVERMNCGISRRLP
jgi:hypothetical protein